MKKYISLGACLVVFALPLTTSAKTLDEIRLQLESVLAQLRGLSTNGMVLGAATTDDYPSGDSTPGVYCPQLSTTMKRPFRDSQTNPPGQVTELQIFLAEYYGLNEEDIVTGYFGKLTEKYVIQFQKEHGLPAYGIVGSMTRAKIAEVCGRAQAAANADLSENFLSATPTIGAAPLSVWFVMEHLKAVGDGYVLNFGDGTPEYGTRAEGKDGVSHTYTSSGTYKAVLYELQDCPAGCIRTLVGLVWITVTGGNTSNPITVVSPNGGEVWEEGVMNTITWKPYGYDPVVNPAHEVSAYLERRDGGSELFTVVGQLREEGKASIHTYMRVFDANSVGKYPPPGQYYVRVVNNNTGAWDRSDAAFTLLAPAIDLKVNGSDGPVQVAVNTAITVSWIGRNVTSCVLYGVTARPGDTVGNINVDPSGSGMYYVSANYVNITCRRSDTSTVSDYVTLMYANQPASLRITTPNGGEVIPLDQKHTIYWSQVGLNHMSIALYKNDMWKAWINKDVGPDIVASGSYTWMPKDFATDIDQGAIFKIYITGQKADGSGYLDDKSDMPFSFVNQSKLDIRVSAPSGGETYVIGTTDDTGDFMPLKVVVNNAKSKGDIILTLTRRNDDLWKQGEYRWLRTGNGFDPAVQDPIVDSGNTQINKWYAPGQWYLLAEWQGADGSYARDFSDTPFTFVTSSTGIPNIRVSSPTGGSYTVGSTLPVSWSSDNAPTGSGVSLWLTVPGPNGAQDFALLNPTPGTSLFPTTGSYSWPIPPSWTPGTHNIHAYLLAAGSQAGCTSGSCVLVNNWSPQFTISAQNVARPAIFSITPSSGSIATPVVITGTGFGTSNIVNLVSGNAGWNVGSNVPSSDGGTRLSLSLGIPEGMPAGTYTVEVCSNLSNQCGSAPVTFALIYFDSPKILSAQPASGSAPLTVTFGSSMNVCDYRPYSIDYGDGTSASFNDLAPIPHKTTDCYMFSLSWPHTYNLPGTYTAKIFPPGSGTPYTATINVSYL